MSQDDDYSCYFALSLIKSKLKERVESFPSSHESLEYIYIYFFKLITCIQSDSSEQTPPLPLLFFLFLFLTFCFPCTAMMSAQMVN